MKRILGILCAAALLWTAGALAEEEALTLESGEALALDQKIEMDLNGDGTKETVCLRMQGPANEECLQIVVTDADGAVYTKDTDIHSVEGMYAVDLDGDGAMEVLLSGDVYSDDYVTWCFRYDGAALVPLQFADANRGDNTDGYFDYGYGMITAIEGCSLTMAGSQDVLGTWMASRVFTLRDGRFELDDGGLWKMADVTGDPDVWEYRCLTLTKELKVTLEDGGEAVLNAGERMVITQSDKTSIVYFQTKDGVRGSFPIEPNLEDGWGSLIYGAPEYDAFEYLPYAD